ncbi:MAG: nucleoside-diphosphate kinase [Candidatus Liptonbacteria bacterium]|nr:nucleoside-diphosphate kinase [Candidatus Liptonbacteria bacterium]
MAHPKEEKTVIIVKPDGVKRGLIGEIMKRVEQRGLKIIAVKMIQADKPLIDKHLPKSRQWIIDVGNKSLEDYKKYKLDPRKHIGTADPFKIGMLVRKWLFDYWTSGPVVAFAVQGVHAIDMVRKIVGNTLPAKAEMGTIRGDYSVDSAILGNLGKRAVHNIVHASGSPEEARNEFKKWFKPNELHSYDRADDDIMF